MDRVVCSEPTACGCCFIIPTDMLEKMSTSGNPDMAAAAARTMRLTMSLASLPRPAEHGRADPGGACSPRAA